MQSLPLFDLADGAALRFLANAERYSMANGGRESASDKRQIALSYEIEASMYMTSSTSETGDHTSSDAPEVSRGSTAAPDCASACSSTPEAAAAAAALQPLFREPSPNFYGAHISQLYLLSAEDVAVRASIAANVKLLLRTLTGYEADDIIDLLYVNEKWFSTEVLIYALCLVNRLTFRYPSWYAPRVEVDSGDASTPDSPVHCSYSSRVQTPNSALPHVCSSTSSDVSHVDNENEIRVSDGLPESREQSHSGGNSSLGDVFNRYNTRRRIVALLLIAGKFHGDVVYKTSSLASALNKFRDEKCAAAALASSTAAASFKPMASRPLPRVAPAHLGQCEKRLFQELGCTVFVHRHEYQQCEEIAFRGV
ncbi:hypothetical protein LSCM1_01877 [Leishmania martiniquensis]|uniref:Uncharacterized protein n=1 Tax=Leishmania martiniquensis TaxID=1580590 RepID=A0A836KE80_9TRYP|nr:hypothetical protein LSCM1_01877 [Leishmania martiniquensis]